MKILRVVFPILLLTVVSCTFGQNTVETVEEEVSAAVIVDIQPTTENPATSTITPTSTEEPATATPIPPTEQIPPTETDTPVPPTETDTPVPPTETYTPVPPTETYTPVPPAVTDTPVPPAVTDTPIPPAVTDTPVTPAETDTLVPSSVTDTPDPPAVTDTPDPDTQETEAPNVGGSLLGCPILYLGQYYSYSGADFMNAVGANETVTSVRAEGSDVIVEFSSGKVTNLTSVPHIEVVRLIIPLIYQEKTAGISWIDITPQNVLDNVKPGTQVFSGYSDPSYGEIFKLGVVCEE